jgi:sensor domain CHASE-containing protein
MADLRTIVEISIILILAVSLFTIWIMYVRIRQLTSELNAIKNRVEVTDEELDKLARDIEEFKKLRIL